jgi:lipid-A-disaccharide synthase
MPNLLAGKEIFPELIQNDATADNIHRAALDLLDNEPRRTIQTELRDVIVSLGQQGASHRAARAILAL